MDPNLFIEPGELNSDPEDSRQFLTISDFEFEVGRTFPQITLAYQTWGKLNKERSNAILIHHALSGDSNAAVWWNNLVGPGKALDTDQYFVVCSNALGGCQGSTGPASLAADGKPWGSRFPMVTVGDMVEAQSLLLEELELPFWCCVAGGSMGGMQSLEWTVRFPDRVKKAFITASSAFHSPMQIGFNEVGRQAIMRDPKWNEGDYDPSDPPVNGLSVARMLGHLSFLSAEAFESKFGRRLQGKDSFSMHFGVEFEVESYLNYQGDKFTKRFDANSLLHLTRAIDYYEWKNEHLASADFLFVSYDSDWIYPTSQSVEMHRRATEAGLRSRHVEISLPYGHDAFLLDGELQGHYLRSFLNEST